MIYLNSVIFKDSSLNSEGGKEAKMSYIDLEIKMGRSDYGYYFLYLEYCE